MGLTIQRDIPCIVGGLHWNPSVKIGLDLRVMALIVTIVVSCCFRIYFASQKSTCIFELNFKGGLIHWLTLLGNKQTWPFHKLKVFQMNLTLTPHRAPKWSCVA